jgi:hypothetical protein
VDDVYIDDYIPSHPLTDLPDSADFIQTTATFPEFPAGSSA